MLATDHDYSDDSDWMFDPAAYLSPATAAERNLAVALRLAGHGLHIFPTRPDKSPRVAWSKLSTTDLNQIRRWWATWPDSLVGLDLARAGLVAIDADRHGGPDGVAAFEALARENSLPDGAPVTETPNGGRHIFFRQPDGAPLTNRVGALPHGIDVRGSGGLVIAPGSTLPDGREWASAFETPDLAEAFSAGIIQRLPAWLENLLRAPKGDPSCAEEQPPTTTSGAPAGARERAWAERALEGVAADLAAIGEGGRNQALNAAAYRLGRIVARGWLSDGEVRAALEEACRMNGLWKADGPRSVRATIASGLRSGLANPHEDLPERDDGDPSVARLAAEIGRTLVEDEDGTVYDQDTGEVFQAPPRGVAQRPGTRKPVVLNVVNAASLAGLPVPPRRWLVQDMIPEAKVTLLYGDGGSGKSLLALQLATSVATGSEWLGECVERGRALYLSAEDEIDEHHRRLDAIDDLRNLESLDIIDLAGEDAVLSAPMGRDGMMRTTALFDAVRAEVAKRGPSLLVLDNLADVFGGDEIKKLNVRQFLTTLNKLAREFKLTVLLLAHPSINGMALGSGTSGNVAWSNSVRSRLYFERVINRESRAEDDPDIRVLTTKKSNGAAIGGKITVRWMNWKFEREKGIAPNLSNLIQEAEYVFLKLLAQFEREGRTVSPSRSSAYAPTVFSRHHDAKGIAKDVLEKAMNRLFEAGRIKVEQKGSSSHRRQWIAIADPSLGYAADDDVPDLDSERGFDDAL